MMMMPPPPRWPYPPCPYPPCPYPPRWPYPPCCGGAEKDPRYCHEPAIRRRHTSSKSEDSSDRGGFLTRPVAAGRGAMAHPDLPEALGCGDSRGGRDLYLLSTAAHPGAVRMLPSPALTSPARCGDVQIPTAKCESTGGETRGWCDTAISDSRASTKCWAFQLGRRGDGCQEINSPGMVLTNLEGCAGRTTGRDGHRDHLGKTHTRNLR